MRHEGWPERLAALLARAERQSFRFGRYDCALFAADNVHALTGSDPATPWRGYTGKRAAEAIRARDGDLPDLVCAALGQPLDNPLFAQRGDVVYMADDDSLGVCVGGHVAIPARPRGLTYRRLRDATAAWRV